MRVFYYLTFDLALVASEFNGQNYCKGGKPENEALGKWYDRKKRKMGRVEGDNPTSSSRLGRQARCRAELFSQ